MTYPSNKQVKRFVAPNMRRALDLVQDEMGPEAVIISSQKIDQGVEIITSIEPDLPTRGIDIRRQFGQKFDAELDTVMDSDSAWRSQAGVEKASEQYGARVESNHHHGYTSPSRGAENLAQEIERAREKMLDAKRREKLENQPVGEASKNDGEPTVIGSAVSQRKPPSYDRAQTSVDSIAQPANPATKEQTWDKDIKLEALQNELADMRMLLQQQLWHMSEKSSLTEMPQQIKMPNQSLVLTKHLARLGLPEELIEELCQSINHHSKVSQAWKECLALLAKRIPVTHEDIADKGGVFAFVGQTGVGKTTTIAKLAARYVLQHGPGKVALVTTDTFRVGAYDQLRSLARILNVTVRSVDSSNSLISVLSNLREFQLVLIDTAGFRYGDPLLKTQLEQIERCTAVKRVLVLACNSQIQTMKASVHAHTTTKGIDACVLTKLDESACLGEAISVIIENRIAVAYLSDGQEIPKDLSRASSHSLVAKAVALLKSDSGRVPRVAGI